MEENQVQDVAPVEEIEQEKLLPQSQVNKIVQREKEQAAQKARREVEERYQREIERINSQINQQSQRNENVSREVDADAIFQQVQERFNQEMQQKQLEAEMTRVANSYQSKMQEGANSYSDFDEVMKEFDPTAFPQLVYLVAGIDNAADVMYELAKNPVKLNALDGLAMKNPRYAHSQLLELSRSIADNKQAKADAQSQDVAAPLDRLQASRVSGSNGKMGVRDLRTQPWLRG
jgi:enoyl-[acyl-carrier-protein] reductase (NADH)